MLRTEADPGAAPFIARWDRARHERAIVDRDEAHLLIVDGARCRGYVLLAGLHSDPTIIELRRIVVVEPGRGLGRRALGLVLQHAFANLGAEQVWLDVMVDNRRARRAYSAAGFITESIVRDALQTPDGPRTLAIMSVLRSQWSSAA